MWSLIKWTLIIFGGSGLLALILALVACWHDSIGDMPKIKFKSFKNFYELNPDRWILHDDCVGCKSERFYTSFVADRFHFGFVDFYRYKLWMHSLERQKENKRKAQITARMVAAVKQDIEANEKKAKKYQNEAAQILLTVVNRNE